MSSRNKKPRRPRDSAQDHQILDSMKNTVKSEENTEGKSEPQNIIDFNRAFVRDICDSLKQPSAEYKAEKTLKIVCAFLQSERHLPRILYSEISSNIFEIQMVSKGDDPISTNLDALLTQIFNSDLIHYVKQKNGISEQTVPVEEVKKFVLRLFDHVHLAQLQINLIIKAQESSEEAKQRLGKYKQEINNYERRVKKLSNELENAQREYIGILGIFATVVVTFMGGLTFSSSVLEAMEKISAYRLIGVLILLGFVLFNLLNLLMKFLLAVTRIIEPGKIGKGILRLNFWRWPTFSTVEKTNFIFCFLLLSDIAFWLIDAALLRHYFSLFVVKKLIGP